MSNICLSNTSVLLVVILLGGIIWYFNSNKRIEVIGDNRVALQQQLSDRVIARDRAVVGDPLYPALGRTERPIIDSVIGNPYNFNYPTRDSQDTYRLVGYLVNKTTEDLGSNVWRLFGRQKYRGSSQGEFYVIPSHGDRQDIKVQLEDSMFVGEKIRDIYALPEKVRLNSPFFSTDEYNVIQLPKTDFTSHYI